MQTTTSGGKSGGSDTLLITVVFVAAFVLIVGIVTWRHRAKQTDDATVRHVHENGGYDPGTGERRSGLAPTTLELALAEERRRSWVRVPPVPPPRGEEYAECDDPVYIDPEVCEDVRSDHVYTLASGKAEPDPDSSPEPEPEPESEPEPPVYAIASSSNPDAGPMYDNAGTGYLYVGAAEEK